MAKTLQELPPHPVRSLLPVLGVMEKLGFDRQVCLKGTGLLLSQLESADARMSLQQELAFYRNALELTGDETIDFLLAEAPLRQACHRIIAHSGGGDLMADGVLEKRGAGTGCFTPATSTKLPRSFAC